MFLFSTQLQNLPLTVPGCIAYPMRWHFPRENPPDKCALVIADNNSVVRISRNPDENDDRISLRQPLLQRVNAPVTSLCLIPIPLKNIYDAICGNEAKRSL